MIAISLSHPLSDLQRKIVSHCASSAKVKPGAVKATPAGLVAADHEALKAFYGVLVFEYGIAIFTAWLSDKIPKVRYVSINDFIDSLTLPIEKELGMKK